MQPTILITGGATGIGAACVERFAAEGWHVALADINDRVGHNVAEKTGALYLHADTRSQADMTAAVAATVEAFGGLTSVFCNAGIHRRASLLDTDEATFDLVVKTNIYGTYHTLRAAVPAIIASGGGTIVINASDQSMTGKANSFAYGLTKGALGQITKSLSIDLGSRGIRVNAVCPGTIRTPLVEQLFQRLADEGADLDQLWRNENADYARGRVGEPAEVAELVYFLASEKSSFCSGGLYLIDGGLSANA